MDRIERYFDIAIKSPDGIKKLREMILSLAMQGKLVPQDPSDPPASELLKEIEVEKKKLIKEGKIKKQEPLPPIKPEEVPYALPAGWEWVRLGTVGEINPRNNATDEMDAAFIPMPLIYAEYGKPHQYEKKKWCEIKKGFTHFAEGDVVLAKITPCYENKKSCVIKGIPNGIGAGTTELHVFRNSFRGVFPEFILLFLKSPRFILDGIPLMTGSAGQKRIPKDYFAGAFSPLPPLAEQKRIVARVDELMALCDKLESERNARNEKRVAVQKTALDRLLTAPDAAGFDSAWEFIDRNFADLYSVPENVSELKKAILQLAVMGKLAPQDPGDQPASELLNEIEAEKKKLIKAGKIKKQEPLPPIKPEEVPYALPSGWEWLRLEELGITQTGTTPPTNHPENFGDFIPFIGPGDIANNIIDYGNKGLSESGMLKGRVIPENSIMMVCIGGSIGKLAINEIDVTCNQQINTITAYPGIEHKFLFLFMQSPSFQGQVINLAGGSATPIINKQKWSLIYTPLPPLAEQRRIVARVDALMSLCDELEQNLKDATDKQTAILNAVVAAM